MAGSITKDLSGCEAAPGDSSSAQWITGLLLSDYSRNISQASSGNERKVLF